MPKATLPKADAAKSTPKKAKADSADTEAPRSTLDVFDEVFIKLQTARPERGRRSIARDIAEERFQELETLRKKHHYTFKELAEKLSVNGLKITPHQLENAVSTVRAIARRRENAKATPVKTTTKRTGTKG